MLNSRASLRSVSPPSTALAALCCVLLASAVSGCGTDQKRELAGESCEQKSATSAPARLLTRSEYQRTVEALLGTQLDVTSGFPPEPVVDGFSNNANSYQINPLLLEKLQLAARKLAMEARDDGFSKVIDCYGPDSACATVLIAQWLPRAFRKPLTTDEVQSFERLYQRAAPSLGHAEAMAALIEAALLSPQFLYRVEAPIAEERSAALPLGPYEMASRLSYFIYGSMPDAELLSAAANNALGTAEDVEFQARRMLETDLAESRVREFHEQWLGLDRLNSIARNEAPNNTLADLRESLLRSVDSVFWSDGSVESLYSSTELWLNPALAELYSVDLSQIPDAEQSGEWSRVSIAEQRHGLLTHPTLMTLLAHAEQSSPILRGVFIRDKILCEPVPPPPPSVNNIPPDPDPNLTTRERFAVHTETPACAQCHSLIDPVGFGFEAYDQLGRFRSEENGLPIDTTGEFNKLTETRLNKPFDNATEASAMIASSDTAVACLTKKWFTFAMGRAQRDGDSCALESAVRHAKDSDGSLKEILIAVATSEAFRFRAPHELDGAIVQ